MPLQMWSREGAQEVLGSQVLVDRLDSRTYAQETTELFSCWVWCRNLDRIPSSHGFSVFPQDAGRVVEMNGYSPPRREVAPPPECLRYDSLIHIDLVEDWTVRETRTPSSGQSGVPSSSSSEEPPYPAVQPFTWRFGVPDGEDRSYGGRRLDGCRNIPSYHRRDDDGGSSGGRRNWRDVAAAPARHGAPSSAPSGRDGVRQRSRSPPGQRQRAASLPPSSAPEPATSHEVLPPPPPLPASGPRPQRLAEAAARSAPSPMVASPPVAPSVAFADPLADLAAAGHADAMAWAPEGTDPMCLELEAACAASLSQPLVFQGGSASIADLPMVPHPWAASDFGTPFSPGPELVSDVVAQVDEMNLLGEQASETPASTEPPEDFLQMLFKAPPAAILGSSPLRPADAPPPPVSTNNNKRSQRQSSASSIPVAQRAILRLAKEMKVVSGEERRVENAAAGLAGRFKEPLSDVDIDGLATLTRVDRDALHRAAQKSATTRAAALAN
nr:uncharacterized protein LOC127347977 [Lolium perenne]